MVQYNIVVVENDEDEQFFIREGFESNNKFKVLDIVKNGDVLFEKLRSGNEVPDVILSDLNMPGKNGYDILSEIKQTAEFSNIPVVITSTSSTRSTMDKCFSLGAAAFLVKPETFIDYGPFIERLYDVLQEKQIVK